MAYFRPLLMAILKKCDDPGRRIGIFKEIERFVFVVFRLTQTRSNYRSSEFSNAVRAIDRGDMDLAELKERLRNQMSFTFTDDFYLLLNKVITEQNLQVESVAPVDDDLNAVYQYLITSDGGQT
jgi:hypothetical protein